MHVGMLFKSLCLRVGRAVGLVAEKDLQQAVGATMARDVLVTSSATRRGAAAIAAKADSALVAKAAPGLHGILQQQHRIELYASQNVGELAMARNRQLEAVRSNVEALKGWQHEPTLAKIQKLAVNGHSESVANRNLSYYRASEAQGHAMREIGQLLRNMR